MAGTRSDDGGAAGSVLLTGGSGFLGKVVLGRMLAMEGRFGRVVLLLRATDDDSAATRLREEIATSEALGQGGRERLEEAIRGGRVVVQAADLAREGIGGVGSEVLRQVDTVIHCAANVSFEEPLDDAMETNALGPARLLSALRAAGAEPHFVHVSTAYAADCRVDVVDEDDFSHPGVGALDLEEMLATARGWRDAASGPDDREEQRRLGLLGRDHAQRLGWADTYALTKALGERLLAEAAPRLTIVRPTIIESALREPRPGWLEGIKVADPLILAYASRGLTHLPGRASNRIDIVPVDSVANACVAAALYPAAAPLRVLAVASSARNPLRLGELAANVQAHFNPAPLSSRNGAKQIEDLRFVSSRAAVRAAARRQRIAAAAARAAAPVVPRARAKRLRKLAFLSGQITRMVKIYAPYTVLDVVFDDANLRRLEGEMSAEDRAALPFDTAAFDWTDYLQEIHLPEVRRLATQR